MMEPKLDGRYTANFLPAKIMMFPELIVPVEGRDDAGELTGKKSWKVEFLLDPDEPDAAGLMKLAGAFYQQAFPEQWATAKDLAKGALSAREAMTYPMVFARLRSMLNVPFSDGTAKADALKAKAKKYGEAYRGKLILAASKPELKRDGTKIAPPALCGAENGVVVDYNTPDLLTRASSKFFSGAECFFEVMFASYSAGKGGVKAYINLVYVTGNGDRLAGGASGVEKFGMHVGKVSHVNPIDDDIPF